MSDEIVTMRAFRAELTGKKVRDAFSGIALPVASIRDRRAPEDKDVISLEGGLLYFHRDGLRAYLTDEFIAFDQQGRELGRVRAPSSPNSLTQGRRRSSVTIVPSTPIFAVEHVRPRGRAPRAGAPANERVTLRLTKAERQQWEMAAGQRSLGDWIRETCNAYVARGLRQADGE